MDSLKKERYARNILLEEIGTLGQEKIINSKILVIGCGGLGSSCLYYLAAAGVGCIGIIDHDKIEISNLQRQIIHCNSDIGSYKVDSAQKKILALNNEIKVNKYKIKADLENIKPIIKNYDIIIDATDNFSSRFIINKLSYQYKKPLVFAAVKGFTGHISIFKSYESKNPCYECFNPSSNEKIKPLPIAQKGIFSPIPGILGAHQAFVALREILKIGESIVGKIIIMNFLKNTTKTIKLNKNPNCSICNANL
jgi:molybdopterin-synthase adenylyltransferase